MNSSNQRRLSPSSRRSPARSGLVRLAGAAVLVAAGSACGGSSGSEVIKPTGNAPTSNGLGSYFLPTPHQGGNSNDMRITGLEWGRLIDVFDTTGDPLNPISLVFEDLLVDHSITDSTLEFEFKANPVSGKEFVVIGFPRESGEFLSVLNELMDTQPVPAKGLGPNVLPPFTAVSRNSAVVINFNDLVDPTTVTAQNILVMAGDPPSLPFEARIVPSVTHGAMIDGTFQTTRVVVDFTISTLDALDDPDLEVNALGLPSAQQVNSPNAALRIPTKTGPGQFTVLTNLSGRELNFASAGPSDPNSPTLDVVRSFRSQGKTDITGDVNNGFLPDGIAPSVLGTQGVFAQQNVPADLALMDVTFLTPTCAMPLRAGDILEFSGFVFQVVTPGQLAGNIVVNSRVVALIGDLEQFGPSFGLFKTTWDPALGAPPECFVRFDPQPGTAPATGVGTNAGVIAEFSEPMDPAQVQALETFRVRYDAPPVADNPMYANVVGRILPAADLKSFVFAPSLPLRHTNGASETYFVEITADDPDTVIVEGITDLAGNALDFGLPAAAFTLASDEPTQKTGGYALRFIDPLGDEDDNGKPDIRGQYLIDPRQVVKPRTFQRFSVLIDNLGQPLIGVMPQSVGPVQTPLSDKGSKTQVVWRYIDMGFGLLDDLFHNLDVEGTNWAAFIPAVSSDKFTNFSISMTHSSVFPDETLDNGLLPAYRFSGLTLTFANNLLDPANISPTVMAAKSDGYTISSSDAFPAAQNSQVTLVPWPVNRNKPLSAFNYWTWRDTGLTQVAGHNSGMGVDPERIQIVGLDGLIGFYGPTKIPTIGLPILTEYRTYPDVGAFALNGFKTSFAINSSYKPCFRSYSTGGVPTGLPPVTIDPDNEPLAQGGYTPAGAKLGGIDNTVYWGQADFVVRISRFHTVWYDSTAAGSQYAPVVLEPSASEYPSDTTVSVAFRGASALAVAGGASTPPEWSDAALHIDPYGDALDQNQLDLITDNPGSLKPFTVSYFPTAADKSKWKDSASALNGARYLQMRVTMTANPQSGLTPEVSAIGVAYSNP